MTDPYQWYSVADLEAAERRCEQLRQSLNSQLKRETALAAVRGPEFRNLVNVESNANAAIMERNTLDAENTRLLTENKQLTWDLEAVREANRRLREELGKPVV